MENQTPQQNSLDPQAIMLAKAIRQTESGSNPTAKGKSGEYGAYQYTPGTWAKDSANAGVNVPLEQASLEQQNQVAYTKIKALKDKGYNVGQIASIWNAGEGEPDAYTGKFSNGKPSSSKLPGGQKNSYGVSYDVPAYAKSVATAYQTLKNGGQVSVDPNNPSSTANTKSAEDNPQSKDWMQKTGDVLSSIFGGKQIGQSIGTLGGLAYEKLKGLVGGKDNSQYYDTSAPSIGQTLGDVGNVALTAGSMAAPEALGLAGKGTSLLGRLGASTALGTGLGITRAVANKEDVGKGAKVGAISGLAGGAVGEAANKLMEVLPKWFVSAGLKGVDTDSLQTALDSKFINPQSGIKETQGAIDSADSEISDLLDKSKFARGTTFTSDLSQPVNTQDILDKTISGYTNVNGYQVQGFPNSTYTGQDILDVGKKLTPQNDALWAKFENGSINRIEMNTLRSDLDRAVESVYTKLSLPPEKKMLGAALAGAMRNDTKVAIPETIPLFDEMSKNIELQKVLQKIVEKGEVPKGLGFRDIMSFLAGSGVGGPIGGVGGVILNRAAQNPALDIGAGRAVQGITPLVKGIGRVARPALTNITSSQ